jgi:predicted Co/Zn/Cd cation transporter (cation efflux family)
MTSVTYDKITGVAIIAGMLYGVVLGLLSYVRGFGSMSLEAISVLGIGSSLVISILLLPIVQVKAGVLSGRRKVEFVVAFLLSVLVSWPVTYSSLIA